MKKMSFETMFEFDRYILSLDQANISINISCIIVANPGEALHVKLTV